MSIDTTNFIVYVYNGYYNFPDLYDSEKDVKVWLVKESEYLTIPALNLMRCRYVDNKGEVKYFGFTEAGMVKCIPDDVYEDLLQMSSVINGRIHLDADYLMQLYEDCQFDWHINEHDKRVVKWKTKAELEIVAEKLAAEKERRDRFTKGIEETLKPFIDNAKKATGSLSTEQEEYIAQVKSFDVTYDYSDDGKVYRFWSEKEKMMKKAEKDLGFGEGMLSAYCKFVYSFK